VRPLFFCCVLFIIFDTLHLFEINNDDRDDCSAPPLLRLNTAGEMDGEMKKINNEFIELRLHCRNDVKSDGHAVFVPRCDIKNSPVKKYCSVNLGNRFRNLLMTKQDDDRFVRAPLLSCCSVEGIFLWVNKMQDRYGTLLNEIYWFEEMNRMQHSVLFFGIHHAEYNITLVYEDLVPGAMEEFNNQQSKQSLCMGLVSTSLEPPSKMVKEVRNRDRDLCRKLDTLKKYISEGVLLLVFCCDISCCLVLSLFFVDHLFQFNFKTNLYLKIIQKNNYQTPTAMTWLFCIEIGPIKSS